jgi:lipopolysaccharide transport system ATP-binding protein
MSDTVISVENVSKIYRLGEIGTGSIAHDVNRWWHRVRGKEDPYLKVGKVNDRTKSTSKSVIQKGDEDDWVYALKDISFQIKQGDVLGIIGRNGAGKSTLLKILSRVTSQTSGKIKIKGRIASLLEVGTGFHPELTGRENIFLNGAILGMRKQEIASKLDEIVEFSGCARYIDTPVKRYSSGMHVRLAFAVAAHLEPEILIVDEVLAVGDMEFQKKCLGKLKDVAGHGRTVLFVSHNMEAIDRLTTRCIQLGSGCLTHDGPTREVVTQYLRQANFDNSNLEQFRSTSQQGTISLTGAWAENVEGIKSSAFRQGESFRIVLEIEAVQSLTCNYAIVIENSHQQALYTTHLTDLGQPINSFGKRRITAEFPQPMLRRGNYFISVAIFDPNGHIYYDVVLHFPLLEIAGTLGNDFPDDNRWGNLYIPITWKV